MDKKLAKQLAKEQLQIQIRKDKLVSRLAFALEAKNECKRKETLAREGALDQLTLSKIKDKWFDAVVDAKVPEMQDNLRHILHYMEKLIEAESYRKILFEDERQELEEKSTLIAQSHMSALDMLFGIYQKRIRDLHDTYNENVNRRKNEAQEEFQQIEDFEKETQDHMNTMLFQKQLNKEKDEEMMNCDMFLKLDDERSKNTEKQEYLRSRLEKKMEKRWGEITSTLSKYDESTKLRRKDYDQLKAKDDADSRLIYQQMKKTQKLFEQVEELKNCLDDCYAPKETMTMIADLREERTKFFSTFKELKSILADEVRNDELNLKNLTVATNSLTSELKSICDKGEQILTMYRICLRLETEYEKIVPVGGSFNVPRQTELGKKVKPQTEEVIITYHEPGNWAKEFEIFDKFWKKVASVQLSKLALQKCIETLEKENKVLKALLTSYLKEASAKK